MNTSDPKLDRIDRANKSLEWAGSVLIKAKHKRFYGKLAFIFEDGEVLRVVEEQSLMPPKGCK